jgi:preprotein translocase subunit SecE
MKYLDMFQISNNWYITAVIYAIVLVLAILVIRHAATIQRFIGEVKGELRKATWPWESDPKIKGFKKYKQLIDSTVVVLIAMLLLAGYVSFWDFIQNSVLNSLTALGYR